MLKRATSSFRSTKSTTNEVPSSAPDKSLSAAGSTTEDDDAQQPPDETQAQPPDDNGGAGEVTGATELTAELDNMDIKDGANQSEASKFKQLVGILRKALNVKDLTGLRISLPANLMEPVGNLEYWNYLDRPDFFAAIGESDDELERFLSVLRWTFTKDLKFVKGKIAKPYNSILGEHFHAYCDTQPLPLSSSGEPEPHLYLDEDPSVEVLSCAGQSSKPKLRMNAGDCPRSSTSKDSDGQSNGNAADVASSSVSSKSATTQSTAPTSIATSAGNGTNKARVVFINEQTSHHPPISHFVLESRGPKGRVRCVGADQVSAKFTGTALKVFPGPRNKGLFVTLPDRGDEEYQITHPTAIVTGLVRASPYATISETTYVTCRGAKLSKRYRAIISYAEESWLSKAKFLVEGVVYTYDEENEVEFSKIKHVPSDRVFATISGCWRGEIRYTLAGEEHSKLLVDMVPLLVTPKTVAPLEQQDPLATRKVWDDISQALLKKDFSTASKNKQALEQRQRDKAEARKKNGETYKPRFFEPEGEGDAWTGRPVLTKEGTDALEKEFKADYPSTE